MSEKLLARFVFEVMSDGDGVVVCRKMMNAGVMRQALRLQSREEEQRNEPVLEQAADLLGVYVHRLVHPDTCDLLPLGQSRSLPPSAT